MKRFLPALLVVLTSILFVPVLHAQRETNHKALESLSIEFEKQWKQAEKRAKAWSKANNIPLIQEKADGTIVQLIDVENGRPIFLTTDNYGAALTTRAASLWEGGSLGLGVNGEGYDRIGEWDSGLVRVTHQEFYADGESRVLKMDGATSLSDHATHVAGTLIGAGVDTDAKGMNYKGILRAYDWTNAESEMTAAASAFGLELSNHSYGTTTGWTTDDGNWIWTGDASISPYEDYRFGYYGTSARNWDVIANNAPYYLITKSAGNDRGQGPSNAGTGDVPQLDGGEFGYDCIGSYGNAKNIMTVGAVQEVLNYTGPSSVVMSSFSSWGPVDDGRIKPEVVAKGVSTYSAGSDSDTRYSSKNGTSMASPNAAGTMALLQQHYQNTHGGLSMLSSTLRALVIHTADEAGPHEGPDYSFGWGLINAEHAATIISQDDVQQNVIDEIDLNQGGSYSREMQVPGNIPLRVTIAWNDPAGDVPPKSLNNRTRILKNDLDLRLIGPNGEINYPYRLDPDNPAEPPKTDGKNFVDNVEQVFIAEPESGTYTLVVDHDGPLVNGMQTFSVIISGINEYEGIPFCSGGLITPAENSEDNPLDITIQWQHAPYALQYKVYFGTDGEGIETPTNIYNGMLTDLASITENLQPSTSYYLQVQPINDFGINEDCMDIWKFTTLTAIDEFPYIMDVEDVSTPGLPPSWQQLQFTNTKWLSTSLISHGGSKAFGCYNPSGMNLMDYDNWLITPPVVVESGKEYLISFYYRGFLPGTSERFGVYWGSAADMESLDTQLALYTGFDGGDDWLLGEILLVPSESGYGFIAFRAESENGYGVFLDDIMIEDWGAVGLSEQHADMIHAYYFNGTLSINLEKEAVNAVQKLYGTDGRLLFEKQFSGNSLQYGGLNLSAGIYVITIENGTEVLRKSFMVH